MAVACVSPQIKLQGTGYGFNVPLFAGGQIHLVALLFCVGKMKTQKSWDAIKHSNEPTFFSVVF